MIENYETADVQDKTDSSDSPEEMDPDLRAAIDSDFEGWSVDKLKELRGWCTSSPDYTGETDEDEDPQKVYVKKR